MQQFVRPIQKFEEWLAHCKELDGPMTKETFENDQERMKEQGYEDVDLKWFDDQLYSVQEHYVAKGLEKVVPGSMGCSE